MKEEPAKQPPTREEVEMTKIVGSVKKVDSISNAISKIVNGSLSSLSHLPSRMCFSSCRARPIKTRRR